MIDSWDTLKLKVIKIGLLAIIRSIENVFLAKVT